MEAKVIIVSSVKSNKSDNKVWAVAITGEEQPQAEQAEEKPKKQRKPRSKKSAEVVALI
ncbi:MAG: hypothetical protein IJM78_07245 [Prevotella sp.]|nr:hypothetical protein [Prevotella sp.]